MRKRILLLTGSPGVGKTSVLLKIVESLKARGYVVGGMVSREVRSGVGRLGFEILDVASGRKGWLAHTAQASGPRVGKYRVNLVDLEGVGVEAVTNALKSSEVIVIDEIGPMELCSQKFKSVIRKVAESQKLVVGVIHSRATDSSLTEVKHRDDAEVYLVTPENRQNLNGLVLKQALDFLSKPVNNKTL